MLSGKLMRILLFYILSSVVIINTCISRAASDTTNISLSFYIVSEKAIDGGRLVDTTDFPKLGYIAAKPDLVITQLEAVNSDVEKRQDTMIDKDGMRTVLPMEEHPVLLILMRPEDAKKLGVLTGQAVGKQVLLMLGDIPLTAPYINMPITTQSFRLTCGKHSDQKKIEDGLKKLVR